MVEKKNWSERRFEGEELIYSFKKHILPGRVAHPSNPCTLEDEAGWNAGAQEFETKLEQYSQTPSLSASHTFALPSSPKESHSFVDVCNVKRSTG